MLREVCTLCIIASFDLPLEQMGGRIQISVVIILGRAHAVSWFETQEEGSDWLTSRVVLLLKITLV